MPNLVRRLLDRPPVPPMPAPFLHVFHHWTRWQDAEATHHSPLFPKLGTWRTPAQVRRCESCGKTKIRTL